MVSYQKMRWILKKAGFDVGFWGKRKVSWNFYGDYEVCKGYPEGTVEIKCWNKGRIEPVIASLENNRITRFVVERLDEYSIAVKKA